MSKYGSFTLGMAYYENPGMLQEQYRWLAKLPIEFRSNIELIVVDDGSPNHPAFMPSKDLEMHIKIFRMKKDIPWNQDACRNLAAKEARHDWLLLTDMDHVPSPSLVSWIMYRKMEKHKVFTMTRVTAPDMTPYKPHPNSYYITKAMYFECGGYDERFRGIYGTDGDFKRRVIQRVRRLCEIEKPLIRYPREVIADASTTTLTRKSPENDLEKAKMRRAIKHDLTPLHFQTPWEQVAGC